MFTIDILPAGRGDCLWIEYGNARQPHRVLIDGGIASTHKAIRARIEALPVHQRRFDLLLISHIDLDHIAGILKLVADPPDGLHFDNVLFNGWEQLVSADEMPDGGGLLGAKLGERVSERLRQRAYPWNEGFEDRVVCIRGDDGALPTVRLSGGMTLTLLSPTVERLRRLRPVWEKEIRKAGLEPGNAGATLEGIGHPDEEEEDRPGLLGAPSLDVDALASTPFKDDTSAANGSSIAVMAAYRGKRCAFLGDAYASDIAASIARMAEAEDGGNTLEIDAMKLSHHGGRKNTDSTMLQRVRCRKYLVSTDGTIYDHPHGESLARVLVAGSAAGKPTLYFNYATDETKPWGRKALYTGRHAYEPVLPGDGEGMSVTL
ncbi:MAG: MBL fold metallo-hydrolase [Gemmatimonadaceae bacterium]